MSLYEFTSEVPFTEAVMVAALSGWVDAGAAATTAAAHIAGSGSVVAVFDSDELFDYRANRPVLDIVDGVTKGVSWPQITATATSLGGRDVALLSGSEPDYRWRAFAASVVDLAHRLGVSLHVTLGGVPAAVPHTLPPPILTTASDRDLLVGDINFPQGVLRVPSAAVSIVDRALYRGGIPTVGFFAQVPRVLCTRFRYCP